MHTVHALESDGTQESPFNFLSFNFVSDHTKNLTVNMHIINT